MHITSIFNVQVLVVAYISRLVLLFFDILHVSFFFFFWGFFKVNSGDFLYNRAVTLVVEAATFGTL